MESFRRVALVVACVGCAPATATVEAPTTASAPPSPVPLGPSDGHEELSVRCEQPGVSLALDGEPRALPVVHLRLEPGEHTLRFSGDRYEALERHVTIIAGAEVDLGPTTLRVSRGNVIVTVVTPGARVSLVSGGDERELPLLPISIDIDTRTLWALHATAPGYCDFVHPIDFSDGIAKKAIEVRLAAGCGP